MIDNQIKRQAMDLAVERMLTLLLPFAGPHELQEVRGKLRSQLKAGALDDLKVTISYTVSAEESVSTADSFQLTNAPELATLPEGPIEFVEALQASSFTEYARQQLKSERRVREETVTVSQALQRLAKEEYELLIPLERLEEHSYSLRPPAGDVVVVPSRLLDILKQDPQLVFKISHKQFEELLRDILVSMGFDVQLTAATRDGGCDLIAMSQDVLGIRTKYVVEAKHYAITNKVGVQLVRQLNTVRLREGAHHGILVTSSSFTRDAVVENTTYYGLHLKDYDALTEWIGKV